jgi:arginyl-tRNA synthetase
LYVRLEMLPFDKYYPESAVADIGLATVKAHIGTTYDNSDGAVIFRGEPYGLFTQVFINSEGLPTYAAKDVGLIYKKQQDYSPDKSFIFTDIAQKDHLSVVLKSISQYAPELVSATTHYTHGQMKLSGGVKMSSRKGNILRATDILDAANESAKKLSDKNDAQVVLASVKYAFLKNRIGGDIIYDPNESVSLEGNSGPYLQYAHARACSIIHKASIKERGALVGLGYGERSLLRKMTEYSEVIDRSVNELMPHHITTYLYELAQEFNRFYEKNRVIGDKREALRLALVEHYTVLLKDGLAILGISAPDKM